MKVLYFLPRYHPSLLGNKIHTEVLEAWRERGITTEVAALSSQARTLVSETHDGITTHQLPVSANVPLKAANRAANILWHYPYLAGAVVHYRRLLHQRHYDLIHVETAFPLGFVAALAPKQPRTLLAVTMPGADIMAEKAYDYGYGRFAAVRAILPWVFRRADVLRADSPQLATLAVRLGASPQKLSTVPYNITADSFPPDDVDIATYRQASRDLVYARHGLDPARPLVVSVNRLHPFKGFLHLVEALPHLHAAGHHPHVLIVGPNRATPHGDYQAVLQQRARQLGVADAIIFTGAIEREQVVRYYAAADVGVVASVAESFSRVAIETAAAGTPVVITRTTGASDYIKQSNCGLVVEPESGAALAEGIGRLLSDHALWQQQHNQAQPFAAHFRSKQIATALYDIYQQASSKLALTKP